MKRRLGRLKRIEGRLRNKYRNRIGQKSREEIAQGIIDLKIKYHAGTATPDEVKRLKRALLILKLIKDRKENADAAA